MALQQAEAEIRMFTWMCSVNVADRLAFDDLTNTGNR